MDYPNKKSANFKNWFVTALIIISVVWLLYGLGFYILPKTWTSKGQFGDSYGALNSLFSGLAFAGLIIGLYMQREELALQREELKATREELKKQAGAQQKSEQALRDQVYVQAIAALVNGYNAMITNAEMQIAILDQDGDFSHAHQVKGLRQSQQINIQALGEQLAKLKGFVDETI